MELMAASREWARRPDDERFLDLDALHAATFARAQGSTAAVVDFRDLVVVHDGDDAKILANGFDGRALRLTHWSFGQLCQQVAAPAAYLRRLPPPLISANLNASLVERVKERLDVEDRDPNTLLYASGNGGDELTLRAMTSASYGRIYDHQVVRMVQNVNAAGNWTVPAASYSGDDPLRATTLYASDRDVFIFLVDETRPIEIDGEQFFRGFFAWNSEVGSKTFGLQMFLYRCVCDNRIVWGARDVRILKIKHMGGAPERFEREGTPVLEAYANQATQPLIDTVRAAKQIAIGKDLDERVAWMRGHSFSLAEARKALRLARDEEGRDDTLWHAVQGATAMARTIPHADARLNIEKRAGELMLLAEEKAS